MIFKKFVPKSRLSYNECIFIGLLIAFLSFIQCRSWMTVSLLSTVLHGVLIGISSFIFILYSYKSHLFNFRDYWPLYIYMVWIMLCSLASAPYLDKDSHIRVFIQHLAGTMVIGSIVFFASPRCLKYIFFSWRWITVPLSLLVLSLSETFHSFGFYINILQIYLLLFSVLNRQRKVLVIVLFVFTMGASVFGEGNSNRTALLKYGVSFLMGFIPYFASLVKSWMLKTFQIVCFASPILLIYAAMTGGLNFFDSVEQQDRKNEMVHDTRTLIYTESISSAYDNKYIIWGRTPARGYDSRFELYRSGLEERSSEVSAVNIFTWYGLVGIILYSILFWKITSTGLFKSRNIYIKVIALFLCFRYVVAWIEDANKLDSTNITIWIMMSMCLLPYFRLMNNKKMEKFIYSKM